MQLDGIGALVAGGASGLGEATARELAARGARVTIADLNEERGSALADEVGGAFVATDVTDESTVQTAVEAVDGLRFAVSCAGIGWAERTVGKQGAAALQPFETVIRVNLIGTFNVLRLSAAAMAAGEPDGGGERGAVVMTASIAAFDGQIGQTAPTTGSSSASPTSYAVRERGPPEVSTVNQAPWTQPASTTSAAWPKQLADGLQISQPGGQGIHAPQPALLCSGALGGSDEWSLLGW